MKAATLADSQHRIGSRIDLPSRVEFVAQHDRARFVVVGLVDRRRPETAPQVRRALLFARSRGINLTGAWTDFPWLARPRDLGAKGHY